MANTRLIDKYALITKIRSINALNVEFFANVIMNEPEADLNTVSNCFIQEIKEITERISANDNIGKEKMQIIVTPQLRQIFSQFCGLPVNCPLKINGVEVKTGT